MLSTNTCSQQQRRPKDSWGGQAWEGGPSKPLLVRHPAYIVIKAAEAFKDKTTAPNELWQTDFTYLKIMGWGWYYLSTVLDDSRASLSPGSSARL